MAPVILSVLLVATIVFYVRFFVALINGEQNRHSADTCEKPHPETTDGTVLAVRARR